MERWTAFALLVPWNRDGGDQAEGKVDLPIEHFDITRYNPQANIGENLLFGELPSDQAGGTILFAFL